VRYPVIAPTSYPPVFYLLEAVVFGAFGPSPYMAKGLVLGFALMAAFYTTAWCRRWIGVNAGWAGALLILLPGVVRWSNCIMLNVPALALSIGALYHFRRWLESPPATPHWRQLYAGAALAVLSILTYVTSCVLVPIAGIWLIMERRWSALLKRRTLAVLAVSALVLLPWAIVIMKFERNRVVLATGTSEVITQLPWHYYIECIKYYPRHFSALFGTHLLFIAAFGIAGGMFNRRWRHETVLLLIMTVVCLAFFSYVPAKEPRYILLLALPTAVFCLLGVLTVARCLGKVSSMRPAHAKAAVPATVAAIFIGQAALAARVPVTSFSGYRQVVEFYEDRAPTEPVFFDGKSHGIFAFYVLAGDPNYDRRVVLGRKLLYSESLYTGEPQEFVSSAEEVVDVLQKRGGCRWVAVADLPDNLRSPAPRYLREAVKGPQFELVESFPITRMRETGPETTNVNVYQFLLPIEQVDEVEMPHFSLGNGVRIKVKPIER
jgi:hypothetical protein